MYSPQITHGLPMHVGDLTGSKELHIASESMAVAEWQVCGVRNQPLRWHAGVPVQVQKSALGHLR
jgi:hypothetical protein